jgi:HSP20 family protein
MKKDLTLRKTSAPMGGSYIMSRFHDIVDDVFSRWNDSDPFAMKFFDDIQPFKSNFPAVDVWSTDTDYKVDIAVAGFNKDEVSLELKDDILVIAADSKNVREENDKDEEAGNECKCLRKEIARRSFRRAVRFPEKVDPGKIDCVYKDGVIQCTIGKVVPEEEDTGIKIEIK